MVVTSLQYVADTARGHVALYGRTFGRSAVGAASSRLSTECYYRPSPHYITCPRCVRRPARCVERMSAREGQRRSLALSNVLLPDHPGVCEILGAGRNQGPASQEKTGLRLFRAGGRFSVCVKPLQHFGLMRNSTRR